MLAASVLQLVAASVMVVSGFLQRLRHLHAQLGVARGVAKGIYPRVRLIDCNVGNLSARPRRHHDDTVAKVHAFIHAVGHQNRGAGLSLPQRQGVVVTAVLNAAKFWHGAHSKYSQRMIGPGIQRG